LNQAPAFLDPARAPALENSLVGLISALPGRWPRTRTATPGFLYAGKPGKSEKISVENGDHRLLVADALVVLGRPAHTGRCVSGIAFN